MNKNNTTLTSGIILSAVFAYLCWYFTSKSMWNAATVIVLLLIAALAAGQYFLWFKFFKKEKINVKSKRK